MTRLTREQAAIIGAYTGVCCGPFADIHEYAERVLDRPVWTHEFAQQDVADELKAAATADFFDLCAEKQPTEAADQ